ncbi:Intradiol ring-cleavage dioxygenase [Colletotrichum godetiae]|uniref:Intradiol ring-cleavage dioxygenase n=1 Tax=Colletotrichum godetiae TaxID=1209918 RepID=A0AAJ0AQ46_9PEZI|nr:Intradiol ring-cleavage dioxygenase [Colletotrichum godetiae]KAK1687617.1 Intradiol ring-cleavage dioxygenase [Colletotrichum godetiae]
MHSSVLLVLTSALLGTAHPGHHEEDHPSLLASRHAHHGLARRGLEACSSSKVYRDLQARALVRRADAIAYHRAIRKRATDSAGVGHNLTSSHVGIDTSSPSADLFGSNHTCILDPEGEIGPFWVKGEHLRADLRDDQEGVDIVLDGQFIDVETCEPITDLYWDLWNCNATGVYSGVQSSMNGDVNDASNLDKAFLRGIQKTDADGVVQFTTKFPGHYDGRATHHHMVAFLDATVLPNNTLSSSHAAHIGQLFWDQDLITEVESLYPYTLNTVDVTLNADDHVVTSQLGSNADSDPFFDYAYLGDDVAEGLFGWITIGVNRSASYETSYDFALTEAGGVAVEGESEDGGLSGGMPSGSGGMPSGTGMFSGSAPVATADATAACA